MQADELPRGGGVVRGRGAGGLQLPAVLHPHQVPPRAAAGRLLPRHPRPHDPHSHHPPGLRRHLPRLAHCRLSACYMRP